MWGFVNQFKTTDSKLANLTSIDGGKWNIPPDKTKSFYKALRKASSAGETLPPFAEKLDKDHPLVFDIDIKYLEKQSTPVITGSVISFQDRKSIYSVIPLLFPIYFFGNVSR